jgi:hypothetical protein
MFGCCCANKKAHKKEQQLKNDAKASAALTTTTTVSTNAEDESKLNGKGEDKNANASSQNSLPATDATFSANLSPTSEGKNDKSCSSEEGNNLSGLIMSDGLVGEISSLSLTFN